MAENPAVAQGGISGLCLQNDCTSTPESFSVIIVKSGLVFPTQLAVGITSLLIIKPSSWRLTDSHSDAIKS